MARPKGVKEAMKRCNSETFFHVCQWLIDNRTELLKNRPGTKELAEKLTEKFDRNISVETLIRAQKTTNVLWATRTAGKGGSLQFLRNRLRLTIWRQKLMYEVMHAITTELGMREPEALGKLRDSLADLDQELTDVADEPGNRDVLRIDRNDRSERNDRFDRA